MDDKDGPGGDETSGRKPTREPEPMIWVRFHGKTSVGPMTRDEARRRFPGINLDDEKPKKPQPSMEQLRKLWRSVLKASEIAEEFIEMGVEIFVLREELTRNGKGKALPSLRETYRVMRAKDVGALLEIKKQLEAALAGTEP